MKQLVLKGTTSYTTYIFVQDSSVTTGAGLTGLVFNSAGLTCYYVRPLAAAVAVTLATQTVTGAYSSGGFVEVSAANCPGLYRLDIPDAALAAGVNSVVLHLKGATNMAPVLLEIQLTSISVNDGVRAGLTALPNAAANAAGGLAVSTAGGLNLDTLSTNQATILARLGAFTGTGVNTVLGFFQALFRSDASNPSDVGGTFTAATDSLEAIRDTAPLGTAMRGTDGANTTTPPTAVAIRTEIDSNSTQLAAILADTNELQTDDIPGAIAGLNNLSAGEVNAEVVDALNTDTYAEPGQGAPPATATLIQKLGYLYKWTRNKQDNDGTTTNFYADDATTVDQKRATSEDAGTVTNDEIVTGP